MCVNVFARDWSTCLTVWQYEFTVAATKPASKFINFFLLLFTLCGISAAKTEYVTCGSVLKLRNVDYDVGLHSHDVRYGTGSGQQSVTGTEQKEDVNSYWTIWLNGPKEFSRG